MTTQYLSSLLVALALTSCTVQDQASQLVDAPETSDMLVDLEAVDWIHGAEDCTALAAAPNYQEWQQVQYHAQSYVFRQNKCSNYEGPFVYLFLGEDSGLLIDTGATLDGGTALAKLIREVTALPILAAHSHGHGDHRVGDDAFRAAVDMNVVDVGASSVQKHFGFSNWPNESTTTDLGGRAIEILPIPGHSDDDLAFYDAETQVVVTGDTLYPGRLYVRDWAEYRSSLVRLSDWVSEKPVAHVLGTHIEMSTTPNRDYPIGTTYQPLEHRLPLSVRDIDLLRVTLERLDEPARTALGSFIIWPVP